MTLAPESQTEYSTHMRTRKLLMALETPPFHPLNLRLCWTGSGTEWRWYALGFVTFSSFKQATDGLHPREILHSHEAEKTWRIIFELCR